MKAILFSQSFPKHGYSNQCIEQYDFFFFLLFHGEANKLAETLFKPLSATLRIQIQQITMLYSGGPKLHA